MAWDLEFKNGDLTGGIVTGDDEVIQRIRTRLFRELGEWFLNTASGLPWYQDGKGILGSPLRDKGAVDLFIRKQALGTEASPEFSSSTVCLPQGSANTPSICRCCSIRENWSRKL